MQQEDEKVEMGDAMEALGEIVKQFAQVAVQSDGLGDVEQSLRAGGAELFGARNSGLIAHAKRIAPTASGTQTAARCPSRDRSNSTACFARADFLSLCR